MGNGYNRKQLVHTSKIHFIFELVSKVIWHEATSPPGGGEWIHPISTSI